MSNYGSINKSEEDCSTEVDALIDDGIPVVDPAPSSRKKWYLAGGFVTFLSLMVFSRSRTDGLYAQLLKDNGSFCFNDNACKSNNCCTIDSLFGKVGTCENCCISADCKSKVEQPPAGEYGKPFCRDNECVATLGGEPYTFPQEGYTVWLPSETIDNSNTFQKYTVPRTIYSDVPGTPVFEQVWYIDFNEQDPSLFNKDDIKVNETHISIPKNQAFHSGYSRSLLMYDEHETGIITSVVLDNTYSVVSDFPELSFVEKYHTLTYDGVVDTSRGDYIKEKSDEQLQSDFTFFSLAGWLTDALLSAFALVKENVPDAQFEAGVDKAHTWQVRRYVNSYPEDDVGTLNPSSSSRWASQAEKAKEAYNLAKDVDFVREYKKSENHCKHFEQLESLGQDETHAIFPLGRPITTLAGEGVTSPVYYLSFAGGHATFDYDEDTNVLQIFYLGYAYSRQYNDVNFPGPYPNGIYVSPVAEGSDYVVVDTDGRSNIYQQLEQPENTGTDPEKEPDFTLWARPRSETCLERYENGDFWEEIDIESIFDSIFTQLTGYVNILKGTVGGYPCANIWSRNDYGRGTHGFGTTEVSVWAHALTEIPDFITKEITNAKYWDSWKCFFQNKNQALCEED